MIEAIYHTDCPKKPTEAAPEFRWDGFFMADHAGYECELCGLHIMVHETDEERWKYEDGSIV